RVRSSAGPGGRRLTAPRRVPGAPGKAAATRLPAMSPQPIGPQRTSAMATNSTPGPFPCQARGTPMVLPGEASDQPQSEKPERQGHGVGGQRQQLASGVDNSEIRHFNCMITASAGGSIWPASLGAPWQNGPP